MPSQRFRFEQYLEWLRQNNFNITFLPLYGHSTWQFINGNRNLIQRTVRIWASIALQIFKVFKVTGKDFVLVHREILPLGPPILEWTISKIFRKKIIYDFDDAIWLTDNNNESWLKKKLRWRGKVGWICKWGHKVSVGNEYLARYARQYNLHVVVNPTTIDTENLHNPKLCPQKNNDNNVMIGWTGSHSTLKYLEKLQPVLKMIGERYKQASFLVIADQPPALDLKGTVFVQWSKETEIEDLLKIDIGVMPLPDDAWARGKCGFKILQYMALGIPSIASPVGANMEVIKHGKNGLLCTTEAEWLAAFDLLINNVNLRKEIGAEGRKTVTERYSVLSNASNFLSLFE